MQPEALLAFLTLQGFHNIYFDRVFYVLLNTIGTAINCVKNWHTIMLLWACHPGYAMILPYTQTIWYTGIPQRD